MPSWSLPGLRGRRRACTPGRTRLGVHGGGPGAGAAVEDPHPRCCRGRRRAGGVAVGGYLVLGNTGDRAQLGGRHPRAVLGRLDAAAFGRLAEGDAYAVYPQSGVELDSSAGVRSRSGAGLLLLPGLLAGHAQRAGTCSVAGGGPAAADAGSVETGAGHAGAAPMGRLMPRPSVLPPGCGCGRRGGARRLRPASRRAPSSRGGCTGGPTG